MKTVVMLAAALCCAAIATRARAEIPFSSCGGTIPSHETGVLQNDVVCQYRCANDPSFVCAGDDDDGCDTFCKADRFTLKRGARLDLNGHHIAFAYQASAVGCLDDHPGGRCTIVGPGAIDGGKGTGMWANGMDMVVQNVAITFTDSAIYADRRVFARGLTILADRENTIYAAGEVRIEDSLIDGEDGVHAGDDLVVKHVRMGPHSRATALGALRGHHLMLRGGASIGGGEIDLKRVEVTGNQFYPASRSLISSTGTLRLRRSHVEMIESASPPSLDRASCAKSFQLDSETTWGVCSED